MVATQLMLSVPLSRVIMRQSVVVAVMLSAMGLTLALLVMAVAPGQQPQSRARPEDN